MPVLSLCPRCRAVMPASAERGRCHKCGEMVVPAARKLCFRCGTDITAAKRVKDDAGEYYCHPCWEDLGVSGRRRKSACSGCGRTFGFEHLAPGVDGAYVCRVCLSKRDDPDALLDAAARVAAGAGDAGGGVATMAPPAARPAVAPARAPTAPAGEDERTAVLRRMGVIWSVTCGAVVTGLVVVTWLTARTLGAW